MKYVLHGQYQAPCQLYLHVKRVKEEKELTIARGLNRPGVIYLSEPIRYPVSNPGLNRTKNPLPFSLNHH